MSNQNGKIQRKIALMNAKKVVNQFSYLELINFEDYDSHWLEVFEVPLKQFRKIDSEPTYSKPIGDNKEGFISWFVSSLSFLGEKKEWFILVPNCSQPVWANVRVLKFSKAVEELWETSESRDFIIADKSMGIIAQIYCEEKNYEIHVGKCNISNINNS